MKNRPSALLIPTGLCLFLIFSGCSDFRKLQKSNDWEKKYEAAQEYYEKGDYYRAQVLLEEVLPIIIGNPAGEKASFLRAYTYYHQRQYLLASHYFRAFYQTYSRSEYAEEALYMHAYSLYSDSPDYNLDQTSTIEAINAMQAYINRYPYSEFADQANKIIFELQEKLALKEFENAKQYHKIKLYKAAVVAFEEFLEKFPDSEYGEEALFLMIESQYEYARQSILSKQRERYLELVDYYDQLVLFYPDSKYKKQATSMYESSMEEIKELSSKS